MAAITMPVGAFAQSRAEIRHDRREVQEARRDLREAKRELREDRRDRRRSQYVAPYRLVTIPSVGPITATAVLALAPPAQSFRSGRDFAAWMGLTPRQRSTGGKERLGSITKAGERTLRRLLIIGAAAVVRQASKRGVADGSWLARMLARKPRMLVIVALANKTARIIWALLAKGGVYKAPAVAA